MKTTIALLVTAATLAASPASADAGLTRNVSLFVFYHTECEALPPLVLSVVKNNLADFSEEAIASDKKQYKSDPTKWCATTKPFVDKINRRLMLVR